MPITNRAQWAQLRVGIMAIAAFAIIGFLIFLMAGTRGLFHSYDPLYTYLNDAQAMAVGAPVRLNGILVGKVKSVGLTGSNDPGRIIKVSLDVDGTFFSQIPVDSQTEIAQETLLSTKYVNIRKGRAQDAVKPGGELQNHAAAGMAEMFAQVSTTLAPVQDILAQVHQLLAGLLNGEGTAGKLLKSDELHNQIVQIGQKAQKLLDTLNSPDSTIGKLTHDDQLYQDFRNLIARVSSLVDTVQKGQGTVGKLMQDPSLFDESKKAIGDLRQLMAGLNNGEGTVGKLLKSDELHEQIKGTIARLDTLLDKINNGQGTISQLLNNPSMYESLDGTTREIHELLKDFRKNPKKFLTIQLKLF